MELRDTTNTAVLVQRSRVYRCAPRPHHHVLRRLDAVTECPEPKHPPDHQELEPHDEQDGVHEQRQNPGAETADVVSVGIKVHPNRRPKRKRDSIEGPKGINTVSPVSPTRDRGTATNTLRGSIDKLRSVSAQKTQRYRGVLICLTMVASDVF